LELGAENRLKYARADLERGVYEGGFFTAIHLPGVYHLNLGNAAARLAYASEG
jgi:hypothetical protein